MQLSEDTRLVDNIITAYQDDTIWVNKIAYAHSIILSPSAIKPWEITDLNQITTEHLTALLQADTELILLGSGTTVQQLNAEQLAFCYEKNIGVEVMTTPAACRTYNLLANEGRLLIAALIIQ